MSILEIIGAVALCLGVGYAVLWTLGVIRIGRAQAYDVSKPEGRVEFIKDMLSDTIDLFPTRRRMTFIANCPETGASCIVSEEKSLEELVRVITEAAKKGDKA